MSAKANPAAIGIFVCVALAIATAGVLTLGMGKFLSKRTPYVVYFDSALSGLDIGAPVELRGVRIGTVTGIKLVYDHSDESLDIPVYLEIERDAFTEVNTDLAGEEGRGMAAHIQKGLRAQLNSQSFVTGKLKVDLGYHPDSEIRYRAPTSDIAELPSVPTTMETIKQRFSSLPVADIVQNVHRLTTSLAEMAESGDLEKITKSLGIASEEFATMVKSGELKSIMSDMQELTKVLAKISKDGELEKLIAESRQAIGSLTKSMEETNLGDTLESINKTLAEGQVLMKDGQDLVKNVDRNSGQLQKDLARTLEDIADAARASHNLLEYLERHPEALIRGKGAE